MRLRAEARTIRMISALTVAAVLAAAPAWAQSADTDAPPALHTGSLWVPAAPGFGFGLDVARLKPYRDSLNPGYHLLDTPLYATDALSFKLRLAWPEESGIDSDEWGQVQPYVSLGPALFVTEPDAWRATGLIGRATDFSLSLGMRAAAGVVWRLSESTELFGAWQLTRAAMQRILPFGDKAESDLNARDFVYGLSVRF